MPLHPSAPPVADDALVLLLVLDLAEQFVQLADALFSERFLRQKFFEVRVRRSSHDPPLHSPDDLRDAGLAKEGTWMVSRCPRDGPGGALELSTPELTLEDGRPPTIQKTKGPW